MLIVRYQRDTVRSGCLSTRLYQQRPLINNTLSTETVYQQHLIVGKIGQGIHVDLNLCFPFERGRVEIHGCGTNVQEFVQITTILVPG